MLRSVRRWCVTVRSNAASRQGLARSKPPSVVRLIFGAPSDEILNVRRARLAARLHNQFKVESREHFGKRSELRARLSIFQRGNGRLPELCSSGDVGLRQSALLAIASQNCAKLLGRACDVYVISSDASIRIGVYQRSILRGV